MSIVFVNGNNRRMNNERPKNRFTAAFLAFITGFAGGHKLYLGEGGKFALYLLILFMTSRIFGFPITMFFGFLEGMRLLNMSDQEFDSKYNGGYVQRGDSRIERRREEQMRRYENEDKGRPYYREPQQVQRVRANPFKSSGLAKYKEFDLDGAISDFNQGLEIDPNDVALNFNLACAYSLTEKKNEAYKHLSKAVSLGFNDFERILTHDDLAFVRIQPEFDAFKASGFKIVQTSPAATASVDTSSANQKTVQQSDELLGQLNRLAALREKGILSEEEFLLEKRKLTRN